MPKAMAFWIVYLIALVFVVWAGWPWSWGGAPIIVLFILIGLLGWGIFGKPIQ